MSVSWGKQVPGDEIGSWQVSEGVDHGHHQRDNHNTGIYDVQLGAEVNFEPKMWLIEHNMREFPCCWKNCPYHATYVPKSNITIVESIYSVTLLVLWVIMFPKEKPHTCHTFPVQFPLITSCLTANHFWFLLTADSGNVCVTLSKISGPLSFTSKLKVWVN